MRLNADRDPSDRLTIEGELDPVSAFWMRTLLERHEGARQLVLYSRSHESDI